MTESIEGYPVLRTKRRTLALTMDRQGRVTLRAPLGAPDAALRAFLLEKRGWIEKKQAELRAASRETERYSLAEGGLFPYLGRELRVRYGPGKQAEEREGTLFLPASGSPEKHALHWLTRRARETLPLYVERWARQTGIAPAGLSFGYAKTRYGSMRSDGHMRLNVALMHFAPRYIDYVIVHELAHRLYPNHGSAFHAYVESALPGAGRLRREMKTLGGLLNLLREKD